MQISHFHSYIFQIICKMLGHFLGQRRHQYPLVTRRTKTNLTQQIIHLTADRPYFNNRIRYARRTYDLLHDSLRLTQLIRGGRRRHIDRLIQAFPKFIEG